MLAAAGACGKAKDADPGTASSASGAGSASGASVGPAPTRALAVPTVAVASTRPVRAARVVILARDGALATDFTPEVRDGAFELAAVGKGTPTTLAALTAEQVTLPPDDPPPRADDAPPPEADDDESGGTGTAMALDEGKMGKKDSDRVPGQYRMKGPDEDALSRTQAIEEARKTGILGRTAPAAGPPLDPRARGVMGDGAAPTSLDGALLPGDGGDVAATLSPIIVADRDAPARALVDLIRAHDGQATLAVSPDGARAYAFAIGFGITASDAGGAPATDVELVVTLTGDRAAMTAQRGAVMIAEGYAWQGAGTPAELTAAYGKSRDALALAGRRDLRLWFDDKATVGQVVLAMDALVAGGATSITIGDPAWPRLPPLSPTAAVPQVRIGMPTSVGDLDKAVIRRYIKRNLAKISYCYEKELVIHPALEGTVSAQFFITPSGSVGTSNASGVDGSVASCIADVIKGIEFPKPKGGGGVQVNYPFTLRPAGG
ncbi:MAG: AgmX/PglI C-terminal domain-containing protein [Deltaproteobacteria bacterium]|nr:AgmX/PglI C-terminal domain-containing protein [Deltaproteobacteria bacterium]